MNKRILAFFVAAIYIVTLLPAVVFADEQPYVTSCNVSPGGNNFKYTNIKNNQMEAGCVYIPCIEVEFSENVDAETVNSSTVALNPSGEYTPIVDGNKIFIDISCLSNFTDDITLEITSDVRCGGKSTAGYSAKFSTSFIAPVPYNAQKQVVNVAKGKKSDVSGLIDQSFDGCRLTEGTDVTIDLCGVETVEAIGWDLASKWSMNMTKIYASTDESNLKRDLIYTGTTNDSAGKKVLDSKVKARYITFEVPPNWDTVIREFLVYSSKSVDIGPWRSDSFTGGGKSYAFSADVEYLTLSPQMYMAMFSYADDGQMLSVNVCPTGNGVSPVEGTISAPDGAAAAGAVLFAEKDDGSAAFAKEPISIGKPVWINEDLSGGDEFEDCVDISVNDGKITALFKNGCIESSDTVALAVAKPDDKTVGESEFFATLFPADFSKLYWAGTALLGGGKKVEIPCAQTGVYYVLAMKSTEDGIEKKATRICVSTDEEKAQRADAFFNGDPNKLGEYVDTYVYDKEIITSTQIADTEALKTESYRKMFVCAREMLFDDGEKNISDVLELLNSTAVLNALYVGDSSKLAKLIKSGNAASAYIPSKDTDKFVEVFKAVKDYAQDGELLKYILTSASQVVSDGNANEFIKVFSALEKKIDDGEDFANIEKWSQMLAKLQGKTPQKAAEAIEANNSFFKCDLNYPVQNGISLSRALALIDLSDVSKYYGEGVLDKAIKAAVDKENSESEGSQSSGKVTKGGGKGSTVKAPVTGNTGAVPPADVSRPADIKTDAEFADLSGFEWASAAIAALVKKGAVCGDENGNFNPSANVTRAEFIKMLTTALGVTVNETHDMHFVDCTGEEWFYPYVKIACSNGIANGTDEYHFNPNGDITREDMAVMVYNALILAGSTPVSESEGFSDSAQISDYALKPVLRLSAAGVIKGFEDGTFAPSSSANRAQAATMINGIINYISEVAK